MNFLDILPWWAKAAIAAAIVAACAWGVHTYNESLRQDGRDEKQAEWNADKAVRAAVDLQKAAENAAETHERLMAQQENQRAQNQELAAARRDAAVNARTADELREQNASTAKQWREALRNSPTVADRETAADAIGVLADVLGRADRRAGILASYADAARAAGLKCERDYSALTPAP